MRLGLLALLSIGCTSTLPFYEPLCVEADRQTIGMNELLPSGDSPNSLLAEIATRTITAKVYGPDGVFTDTFTWSYTYNGPPQTMMLDGNGWRGADCPTGLIMELPVQAHLQSSAGLDLAGDGRVWVDAQTGERWFDHTLSGPPVEGLYTTSQVQCRDQPADHVELHSSTSLTNQFASNPPGEMGEGIFSFKLTSESAVCNDYFGYWMVPPEEEAPSASLP